MLRILFSATILAGALAGSAMAQAPDAGRLIKTLWREILREGLQPEPAEPAVGLRTVLQLAPVGSPQTAVKEAIAAQARSNQH